MDTFTCCRILGLALIVTSPIIAQGPTYRVADINTVPSIASSRPEGDRLPFSSDGPRSWEYRSRQFASTGGQVLFTAETAAEGRELWVTNGTTAGTVMVADLYPGIQSSNPRELTGLSGIAYFQAASGPSTGGLFRSDGTAAGTYALPAESFSRPVELGGALLFASVLPASSGYALMRTDGTIAGTTQIATTPALPGPIGGMTSAGSIAFFVAGNSELWTTDGVTATFVRSFGAGASSISGMVQLAPSTIVFAGNDGAGTGSELWISDGTAAGTTMVAELFPGPTSGVVISKALGFGGQVYFQGRTPSGALGLWVTNGTAVGTLELRPGTTITWLEALGGMVYCNHTAGMVETNGTVPGTVSVAASPGLSQIELGGVIYYAESTGVGRSVLWFDGTTVGTVINPWPTSNNDRVQFLTPINATQFVFAANDGIHGEELWISDGTAAGSSMLLDIYSPGWTRSSSPDSFAELEKIVYFAADDQVFGRELWRTDGTAAGTFLVSDIRAGVQGSAPTDLARLGDYVLFSALGDPATGRELWATDGTAAGTTLLADIVPGSGNGDPRHLTRIGELVYFSAMDATFDHELWRTDGTAAGTWRVADIDPAGSSLPHDFCELGYSGSFLFAASQSSDTELWISDGTATGTTLLSFHPGAIDLNPAGLTRLDDRVAFAADDVNGDRELWISDGTFAGTHLLVDINTSGSSAPQSFARRDEPFTTVVFTATNPSTGREIWMSDGTAAGTLVVANTINGPASNNPTHVTVVGNREVWYSASDSTAGREPWTTQGTAFTGQRVMDINPGSASSNPTATGEGRRAVFADSRGRVFYAADDGMAGIELWVSESGAWWRQIGRPCGVSGSMAAVSTSVPTIPGLWQWDGTDAPLGWTAFPVVSFEAPSLGHGCAFHLDWGTSVAVSPFIVTNPLWSYGIPIPNWPGLIGVKLMTQTFFFDAPTSIDATNAVIAILGL